VAERADAEDVADSAEREETAARRKHKKPDPNSRRRRERNERRRRRQGTTQDDPEAEAQEADDELEHQDAEDSVDELDHAIAEVLALEMGPATTPTPEDAQWPSREDAPGTSSASMSRPRSRPATQSNAARSRPASTGPSVPVADRVAILESQIASEQAPNNAQPRKLPSHAPVPDPVPEETVPSCPTSPPGSPVRHNIFSIMAKAPREDKAAQSPSSVPVPKKLNCPGVSPVPKKKKKADPKQLVKRSIFFQESREEENPPKKMQKWLQIELAGDSSSESEREAPKKTKKARRGRKQGAPHLLAADIGSPRADQQITVILSALKQNKTFKCVETKQVFSNLIRRNNVTI
jgi:hypothetical protein